MSPRATLPSVSAVIALGVGVGVLLGWIWDIEILKRVIPGLVSMNPMTAIAFILAGLSLWARRRAPDELLAPVSRFQRRCALVCAVLVFSVGMLRLLAPLLNTQTTIDQMLFPDKLIADDLVQPNRMAPNAAMGFVLLGLALMTLDVRMRRKHDRPAEFFAVSVLLISLLALIGYAYEARWLYGIGKAIPMALHTALVFHLLALGILYARPREGLMKVITSDSPGGAMARRLFPYLVPVLLGVGWLRLAGQRQGFYDLGLGVAFHTIASITILGVLIWSAARSLHAAEERRLQLEAEQERFFTLSPDMFCITDPEGRFKRLNPAFDTTLGYDHDEMLGRPLLDLVHPDDQEATVAALTSLQCGKNTLKVENRCRCRSGEWKWFSWSVRIYSAEGALYASARDITERKRNEQALKDSEERATRLNETLELRVRERTDELAASERKFRILVEQSLVGIYILQGDRHVYVNPKTCEILGYSQEELTSRPIAEFIINDDLDRALGNIRDRLDGRVNEIRYQLRMRHKNGSVIHVEVHGSRSEYNGAPAIIGTALDVTERKQAEARLAGERNLLRTLIDNLPGYIFVKDTAGRYLVSNDAHTRRLGATAESDLIGKTVGDFFPPEVAEKFEEDDRQLLQCGQPVIEREEPFETNGALSWHSITKVLSRDAQGNIAYLVGIRHDITDRKRAEEEIRMLNSDLELRVQERTRQLEDANKELETFSYSVSHDLRAPLRHIQGYVEMLEEATENQLSDTPKRYLKTIRDVAVEMGQLIDDLLDFSRMSRASLHETKVPLDALVADIVRSLEMAVKDRQIEWKIASLPPVLGDPSALKQVMANLIGNAVKYTRNRDTAEIEIGCAGQEADKTVLYVKDNGAGFDMKYVDKLFGVFQRLHRSDEFEGTGIGLATVRRIIGRHGGRTWAEGAVNKGASIYFTLKPALTSWSLASSTTTPAISSALHPPS